MPNWCCTNYVAKGPREQLQGLCDAINKMPNLIADKPHSFGRYWIGNLVCFLEKCDKDSIPAGTYCRGVIDPNPNAVACMFGPAVDESMAFEVDDDGRLRFSVVHAWSHCDSFDNLVQKHFPEIEFSFTETDEFGNFHDIFENDDEDLFPVYFACIDGEYREFMKNERDKFVDFLMENYPKLGLAADVSHEYLISEEFQKRFRDCADEDEGFEDYAYAYVLL